MDVPLKVVVPPPRASDVTPTPGAAKSTGGLPKFEKDAKQGRQRQVSAKRLTSEAGSATAGPKSARSRHQHCRE